MPHGLLAEHVILDRGWIAENAVSAVVPRDAILICVPNFIVAPQAKFLVTRRLRVRHGECFSEREPARGESEVRSEAASQLRHVREVEEAPAPFLREIVVTLIFVPPGEDGQQTGTRQLAAHKARV